MALNFASAGSDRVDCGSAGGIDDFTAFTFIAWLNPTTTVSGDTIFSKGADVKQVEYRASVRLRLRVGRATTGAEAESSNNFLTVGTDHCFACTYDESDGPRLFVGSTTVQLIEDAAYSTQTVGSGATTADAASALLLGNRPGNDKGFGGDISTAMYLNTRLTLKQLQALQWRMVNQASTKGHWILGLNGAGAQPDLSGNANAGTITGATVADHAPIPPPFGFDLGWQGAFAAAAPPSGRIMGSLAGLGGLAGHGGLAGRGGGIAA